MQINAQSPGIAVPTALAARAGTCAFRALVPDALVGKVLLGICGGVSTLGLMKFGVMAASHENSAGTIQGAVAFGTVLALMGALAGVAAGVTAFIGQALVRSLLTWAAVLAVLAVGLYELLLGAAAMQKP